MYQLPLGLRLAPSYRAEDFIVSSANQEAWARLQQWPEWPDRVLALSGPGGSGKAHLAHVWAERAQPRRLDARTLNDATVSSVLDRGGAYIYHQQVAEAVPEVALFHFLNAIRQSNGWLLIITRELPARWPVELPDLASRLRAVPVVEVTNPDDTLVEALLMKQLTDAGLRAPPEVVAFLSARVPRHFTGIREVVNALDALAMANHREVTIPLARQAMVSIPLLACS